MKRNLARLFAAVIATIAAVSFSACRNDIVFTQFHPIPSDHWAADSVIRFDYSIADNAAAYRMIVYVRHTERYPYQNMWLFVKDHMGCDTLEFYLADDRGQWLGDRHHGFIEMPVLFEDDMQFADTGNYFMEIRQGMRDSLLRGVTDVGLEIIKNE